MMDWSQINLADYHKVYSLRANTKRKSPSPVNIWGSSRCNPRMRSAEKVVSFDRRGVDYAAGTRLFIQFKRQLEIPVHF